MHSSTEENVGMRAKLPIDANDQEQLGHHQIKLVSPLWPLHDKIIV